MLRAHLLLGFVGVALAGRVSRALVTPDPTGNSDLDSAIKSCQSLKKSCNSISLDFSNFYRYVPCIMLTTCSVLDGETPTQVLVKNGASTNQPRLTEETFRSMSGGNSYMSQQNYIDAYYNAISHTPDGSTYPNNITDVIEQWEAIAAWTGSCDTMNIPYNNFADWLEYSSTPGVCGAVPSCKSAATSLTCVPQPPSDNGSCAEMVQQCQLWVDGGLFQNQFCVLASMCYAWSNTDVLLAQLYPSETVPPTTSQQARLSEDVFYDLNGCTDTLSQQDVVDAYYRALTGTWVSSNGTSGNTSNPVQTANNGPYPTSPQYVTDFWGSIAAWTGNCGTREIPYTNLADYFSYAAGSNYHPSC